MMMRYMMVLYDEVLYDEMLSDDVFNDEVLYDKVLYDEVLYDEVLYDEVLCDEVLYIYIYMYIGPPTHRSLKSTDSCPSYGGLATKVHALLTTGGTTLEIPSELSDRFKDLPHTKESNILTHIGALERTNPSALVRIDGT